MASLDMAAKFGEWPDQSFGFNGCFDVVQKEKCSSCDIIIGSPPAGIDSRVIPLSTPHNPNGHIPGGEQIINSLSFQQF